SKRWLNYAEIDHLVTVTGQQSYTIGPGGDIPVTARPDRIEYGFIRLLNSGNSLPVDIPLRPIMSHEDYSRVTLKTLKARPASFFTKPSSPWGRFYRLPVRISLVNTSCSSAPE